MSPEFLEELKDYVELAYGKTAYKGLRASKASGVITQNGHECLRCCDPALTPELFAQKETNALKVKVYTLIWQRTIASVMPNAVYSEIIYTVDNNGHKFEFCHRELTNTGYKAVYNYESTQTSKIDCTFEIGEALTVVNKS